MGITDRQKASLLSLLEQGDHETAIEQCVQMCEDNLAAQLLERGGFGILQLNPHPLAVPRMRFATEGETLPVSAAMIAGMLVHRDAS